MTEYQFKRHLGVKVRKVFDNLDQYDHLQNMRDLRSFLEENVEHLKGGDTQVEFILDIISLAYHAK